MARIIAITNQKGGVGKTTTTTNLAAYLAKAGHRVLVVDVDPQGNATSGLGLDKANVQPSLYEVLLSGTPAHSAIKQVTKYKVSLLPSHPGLAGAEVELVPLESREYRLRQALSGLNYDFVLLDSPPSLGLLTINSLAAADDVLIPVQSEYYALEGLSQLLATIQQVHQTLNPNLSLLGVVMTMYDLRNSLSEQVRAELQQHFGGKVFDTIIPRNVRLAEAPSFGLTIAEHDRWSKGARAYKALAKELEERVK